jgi:ABC-type amino acid transport substrate-binding protein
MTADTTATVEQAAGAQIAATGAGFFYQPQAFAARRGEADFVAVLDGALKTMRRNGTLSALSRKWYHGLDVSARPAASVPLFSRALAMLKAGTYPLQ